MTAKAKADIKRKMNLLRHAEECGNISEACRYFGLSRQAYYKWKKRLQETGESGLVNLKPCPQNLKLRTPKEIEEKILYLRRTFHFGQRKISWFLLRYHQIKISESGVRGVLLRNGVNRLPKNMKKDPGPTYQSYEKQVPGHHVQVDVKFLNFEKEGKKIRRFQYTAIDDATRIRLLRVYDEHTLKAAIDFIDQVIAKMPFRIKMVRTDNGHEFQSQFRWHLMDCGIEHAYIKPGTPRLNGKVERSHRIDNEEFYQLLEYTDDMGISSRSSRNGSGIITTTDRIRRTKAAPRMRS